MPRDWKSTTLGLGTGAALMSQGFDPGDAGSWIRLVIAVLSVVAGFLSKDA